MPLKNFRFSMHSRLNTRKVQPVSLIVSPDSLFRTQLAMREEATRMKLSPLPRASTRVPQTQSKRLSGSRNLGMSFGSFCKSASSVNRYCPRAAFRPAQMAADSPQLKAKRCARIRGSLAASSLRISHDLSLLPSSVMMIS